MREGESAKVRPNVSLLVSVVVVLVLSPARRGDWGLLFASMCQNRGTYGSSANRTEPWSGSLTANPGQRLTVPDSLTALTLQRTFY